MPPAAPTAASPTLVTYPPMIDSELARFALTHYGIGYREEAHVFGYASLVTLWRQRTIIIPLLYSDAYSLPGPRRIIDHFEARCPAPLKLIPAAADKAAQVEADWDRYHGAFASATGVIAYYHLLPHPDIMIGPMSQGAPAIETRIFAKLYPAFAATLRLLKKINAQTAQTALDLVRQVCDEVGRRLADGRPYLAGDGLTLSDLSFLTAVAPVVLPDAYGGPIPTFAQSPPALQAIISELRQTEAGRFALRLYAEERHRAPTA